MRASLLVLAVAFASGAAAGPALAAEQRSLVVVLDPGHGGKFPHDGAHGAHGLIEKNIALAVTLKVKALLEAQGATVVLTRDDDDDVPLSQRAQIANESGGDLFLSIHCNSMESREDRKITRGVETYFLSPDPTDPEAKMLAEMENGSPDAVPLPRTADPVSGLLADLALGQARNDSAQLAEIIHRSVIRGTWATSRGVRQAPFLVLSGTRMPSALVEIGFISHPAEGRQLGKEKYQQRVAESLAAGVREFSDKVLARRLFAKGDPALAAGAPQRSSAASPTAQADAAAPIGVAASSLVPAAPAPRVAAPGPTR